MEKAKIDRVIDAFRAAMYSEFEVNEEGMVANPPGQSGGFSATAPAKGPRAGFSPVMTGKMQTRLDGRTKGVKKFLNKLIKNREKRKNKKDLDKALKFNSWWK